MLIFMYLKGRMSEKEKRKMNERMNEGSIC